MKIRAMLLMGLSLCLVASAGYCEEMNEGLPFSRMEKKGGVQSTEDDQIKAAAIQYMESHYPSCREKTKVREMKMVSQYFATAFAHCYCGMDCGHGCPLKVEKKNQVWKVTEEDYLCSIS